ncbi:hypothetical protein BDV97DRAFT_312165 [Delphinella strobiligena]|nr:hypothetical protein BDV97DRAFT_312165 [Delphinella strobiligena]
MAVVFDERISNITIFTSQSPIPIDVPVTLGELGLPYQIQQVDEKKGDTDADITLISDTFRDGEKIRIFERSNILLYLIEQYDKDHKISYPKGSRQSYEVNNWLFRIFSINSTQNHSTNSTSQHIVGLRNLNAAVDYHLGHTKDKFLVGDKCTVADIAHWSAMVGAGPRKLDTESYPHLKEWEERMAKRYPSFVRVNSEQVSGR